MSNLTIHGHPLHSSAAIRAVIEDMRKTHRAKNMVLDMGYFGHLRDEKCFACAGGSAVIHGMGASRRSSEWSDDQDTIAFFYNDLRMGFFNDGNTIDRFSPEAQSAWSENMRESENPKTFFAAWEQFADAVEASEKAPA